MKAIPFLIGVWMPYWFGWFGGIEFPVSASVVVCVLVLTKTMKLL